MATARELLAVDVGGTDTKAALVRTGGPTGLTVVDRVRLPTPRGEDGTATGTAVVGAIADLAVRFPQVAGVGVVVPGVVHDGIGIYSANLGWRDFPFAGLLADAVGLPVAFGHDVAAGGLAEQRLGAARGCRDVVVLPIGTGIAAALVLDGELRTGGGYAGEIGHVDVGHGQPCGCGQTGCLEAVASSAAIARGYTARTGQPVPGAAEVIAAAAAGDPDAAAVWDAALDALARGLRVLTTLLGPQVVVLGGGLARAGERLLDPVRDRLAGLVTFQRLPELRLAELGDEAGCLGAGLLVRDLIEGEP